MTSTQKSPIKIVFFGGPAFSIPAFAALFNAGYELVAVTTPDAPKGRSRRLEKPPLKLLAAEHAVPCFQPERFKDNRAFLETLKGNPANLFVVAAYGKLIPKEYLEIPKHGSINIHPSLLPKYRGPTPIQSAILSGDEETGVTIMLMDEELDHGAILRSEKLKVKNEKFEELQKKLAEMGARLLIETIPDWMAGKIKPKAQDHGQATYTKKFLLADGEIDWSKGAKEIWCQIRALNPEPGTWTMWNGKRLKILDAEYHHETLPLAPGTVTHSGNQIAIAASKGVAIPTIVQLESKKTIPIKEFIKGYPKFIGSILTS